MIIVKTKTIDKFERWLKMNNDELLHKELISIQDNPKEIEERFYKDLTFGTAGLRGILGVGPNRMNIYTVRKVSQAISTYLKDKISPSIAIAYDSRINSELFAKEAAKVFAANNITAYIYDKLMPTPMLSYATRKLKCNMGINITASHNPAKYNGYKVYDETGCQINEQIADEISKIIDQTDEFNDVKITPFDNALNSKKINYISQDLINEYYDYIDSLSILKKYGKKLSKIVYTPLNGTGLIPVLETLRRHQFNDVILVDEQAYPNGNFPTCLTPNPELKEALDLGIKLAIEKDADIVLATDPDCDRVGIAVKYNNFYHILNGNEIGVLLFDFICQHLNNHEKYVMIKSIVSTNLTSAIADKYNIRTINTLTGFKYIGEQITRLENKQEKFAFGFEESCGYLSGDQVRDKDGVNASLLIAEMCEFYKRKNLTLIERLEEISKELGYYHSFVASYTFEGIEGIETMKKIMQQYRDKNPKSLVDNLIRFSDYQKQISIDKNDNVTKTILPISNVLQYDLDDNSSIIIRPSGTEPKLKIYYMICGKDKKQCESSLVSYQKIFQEIIKSVAY